jgi:acetyltransferase-like isoleucine patch superfamily enzyme
LIVEPKVASEGPASYEFAGVSVANDGVPTGKRAVCPAGREETIRGGFIERLCQSLLYAWFDRTQRYMALPRNLFYSRLLRAEDIFVGSGNTIKGIKGLEIGRSFRALDQLWLAAVDSDRAGNRYTPSLIIGNDVVVGYGVHVAATNSVRIGNDVLIGSRVIITDHNHGIYTGNVQSSPFEAPGDRLLTGDAEVVVEDNVWIGDGVAILPGSRIGQGSIIGANSVVNCTIPKFCIAAGNPARPIKIYDCESRQWIPAHENPFAGSGA